MATESVGTSTPKRGSTGQFMRQGHTAGIYGNDPNVEAMGVANQPARELKPTA